MSINLETFRSIVRPYISRSIELPEMLEKLWPSILEEDENSKELAQAIEDVLGLHAARLIDGDALRQRLAKIAFPPPAEATIVVSEQSARSVTDDQVAGVVIVKQTYAPTDGQAAELIPA